MRVQVCAHARVRVHTQRTRVRVELCGESRGQMTKQKRENGGGRRGEDKEEVHCAFYCADTFSLPQRPNASSVGLASSANKARSGSV
jgi:hypothetical protein